MDQTGLVLEGGGMRCTYSAGILEYFLDHNIQFPYVIGSSAGASVACSYISGQKGRNKKVNIGLVRDPRFISWRNFLREKSLFGMNFLFDEVPKRIVPLDVNKVINSPQEFVVATTNMETGEPHYFRNRDACDILEAVKASSSLPLLSQPVDIDGLSLMDGGVADPVPLAKARTDGFKNNIVILTRERGYRKGSFYMSALTERMYREYPEFVETIATRAEQYNETIRWIEELEDHGEITVLRPPLDLNVKRTERNPYNLLHLYRRGYHDARRLMQSLQLEIAAESAGSL
ncbi:putative patatin/cPLA2 family phospholipase [Salsuginibacillus halophilus]|uniref:Putative patatin/cPLA2 family phospholipase n=1 Tax=Salsuginibacillus halophilus TaxID=517424 RepID=A0A2P8HLD8_9BACI|nr:patatin family protein [Salsuginibacillus halophilus]PSL47027.1 putative patatin/cPLA2 family phospholipase [Salsuginibacillus halophilus]